MLSDIFDCEYVDTVTFLFYFTRWNTGFYFIWKSQYITWKSSYFTCKSQYFTWKSQYFTWECQYFTWESQYFTDIDVIMYNIFRCPIYNSLPPGCTLKKKPGECCSYPDCGNGILTNGQITGTLCQYILLCTRIYIHWKLDYE